MRLPALIILIAACAVPVGAAAEVKTSVKTAYYKVSGTTGEALMQSMDSNGPRHGFLARAIAQTRYTVDWTLRWRQSGSSCRLAAASARLAIDYRYPRLANQLSPAMQKRWTRFLAGVRKHEEVHGRIARDMAAAADKAVRGVGYANDPSCRKAQKEVERRVNAVYATYEAKQRAFDDREHAEGGAVERLVGSLVLTR